MVLQKMWRKSGPRFGVWTPKKHTEIIPKTPVARRYNLDVLLTEVFDMNFFSVSGFYRPNPLGTLVGHLVHKYMRKPLVCTSLLSSC